MDPRAQDLAGKVALITGGTRGIGRGIALQLASRGCSILVTCSKPESLGSVASLQKQVAELFGSPTARLPIVVGLVADIYQNDCARNIAGALNENFENRVDIVLLNAAAAYTNLRWLAG